jgi:hypothetical protein
VPCELGQTGPITVPRFMVLWAMGLLMLFSSDAIKYQVGALDAPIKKTKPINEKMTLYGFM